jgi:hypothetical protein
LSYTKRWIKQVIQAGDSGGPAERSNLLSQMEMGIRACIGKGILHKALKDFPAPVRNQIASKYGVKLIHT